jgi:hypothetical protein
MPAGQLRTVEQTEDVARFRLEVTVHTPPILLSGLDDINR